MKKIIIIMAGGLGKRMDSSSPKQLIEVGGKTILEHTLDRFFEFDPNLETILVLHQDLFDDWKRISEGRANYQKIKVVPGGKERFHSVKNALDVIEASSTTVVGIHDAARPLVSLSVIEDCFQAASTNNSAIPVIEPVDSMRVVFGDKSESVNRNKYRIVQTPQCFRLDLLKSSYEKPYQIIFTDDASVFEANGHEIHLVAGNRENVKITTNSDLDYFKYLNLR